MKVLRHHAAFHDGNVLNNAAFAGQRVSLVVALTFDYALLKRKNAFRDGLRKLAEFVPLRKPTTTKWHTDVLYIIFLSRAKKVSSVFRWT